MRNQTFYFAVLLMLATAAPAADSDSTPLAINLDAVQWGPPGGGGGVPLGTQTALQRVDPGTGGVTYYALFPAGTRFDRHWHTHDEFVSVMRGAVTLELGSAVHELNAGAYVVIPGGVEHSWLIPESGDVVILVSRAGPADFNYTE
ncbi:MAG: hypothetical protein PsegKO_28100 [Pseudohongiellaceae bacterium]|jgi:quercetin dioxygenase-like cupin family protein